MLTTTFIVSSLFNKYELLNKKQTFEAISLGLTDRQDVIAENEFTKISIAIKKDVQLKNLLLLSTYHLKYNEKTYLFNVTMLTELIYQLIK